MNIGGNNQKLRSDLRQEAMTPNERFAKAAGIHVSFKEIFGHICNDLPDFTDAIEVLEVMREREDWQDFAMSLQVKARTNCPINITVADVLTSWLDNYILDRTGKLRDAAIEWMEGRK